MSTHEKTKAFGWLQRKQYRLALILAVSHLIVGLIGGMLVLTLCRLAIKGIGRETIRRFAIHESWEANRYDCLDSEEYELAIIHRRNAAFAFDLANEERLMLIGPDKIDLDLLWATWQADLEHPEYARKAAENDLHAANIAKGLLAMTLEKAGRQDTANRIWTNLERAVKLDRTQLRRHYRIVHKGECEARYGQSRPPLELDQAFRAKH